MKTIDSVFNPCVCGCEYVGLYSECERLFWCKCMECGRETDKYSDVSQAIDKWNNGKEK